MKAKFFLKKTLEEEILKRTEAEESIFEKIGSEKLRLKNFIFSLIRKHSSQKIRINICTYRQMLKKIFCSQKDFSVDYITYILEKDPLIPIELFPEADHDEIFYFLRITIISAFKEIFDEKDFKGRWKEYEIIRKEVGKNFSFNIFSNTFKLYGFESIVYPDTGIFPDFLSLPKVLKDGNYKCILDIGAFIGDTAYCFYRCFNPQKIYAFEPNPHTFVILEKNIRLNKMQECVIPIQEGVGLKEGFLYFKKAAEISRFVDEENGTIRAKVTTVDNFVQKNNIKKVDLIKMDIEGGEFDALKGAIETIKRDKPTLLIAIYHKGEHFFEIPGWLKRILPEYSLRFISMNGSSPTFDRYIAAFVGDVGT